MRFKPRLAAVAAVGIAAPVAVALAPVANASTPSGPTCANFKAAGNVAVHGWRYAERQNNTTFTGQSACKLYVTNGGVLKFRTPDLNANPPTIGAFGGQAVYFLDATSSNSPEGTGYYPKQDLSWKIVEHYASGDVTATFNKNSGGDPTQYQSDATGNVHNFSVLYDNCVDPVTGRYNDRVDFDLKVSDSAGQTSTGSSSLDCAALPANVSGHTTVRDANSFWIDTDGNNFTSNSPLTWTATETYSDGTYDYGNIGQFGTTDANGTFSLGDGSSFYDDCTDPINGNAVTTDDAVVHLTATDNGNIVGTTDVTIPCSQLPNS